MPPASGSCPSCRASSASSARRPARSSATSFTGSKTAVPTHVILWPVPVQGEGAAAKIAAAIRGFADARARPDLLIVARGGGSIEDLWAFNEEEVVRAAAESPIPLISAVGHETDTTLIDFASDLRAPTPTAAAELAVPVRSELVAQLGELQHRAQHCLARRIDRQRERFELVTCRWPSATTMFAPTVQRLDETRRASAALPRGPRRQRARGPQPGCRTAAERPHRSTHRQAWRTPGRRVEDGRTRRTPSGRCRRDMCGSPRAMAPR